MEGKDKFEINSREAEELRRLIGEELKSGQPLSEVFDGGILATANVVIFGEYHIKNFRAFRDAITKSLPKLKEAGISTLAVEMDQEQQVYIDRFFNGEISSENLASRMFISPILDREQVDDWKKLFDAAKTSGIKIDAIDNQPESDIENQNETDFENRRDATMFEKLRARVKTGERIICIVGNRHLFTGKELGPDGRSKIRRLGNLIKERHLPWVLIEGMSTETRVQKLDNRTLAELGFNELTDMVVEVNAKNQVFNEGNQGDVDYVFITQTSN